MKEANALSGWVETYTQSMYKWVYLELVRASLGMKL